MLFLLLLSLNAFAIDHLPCQRGLQGSRFELPNGDHVVLGADQLLLKGKLHAFWETGMEDRTGWSIMDSRVYEMLSANGYDALFPINKGDMVFILKPDGSVYAEGIHDEYNEPGEVNILGRHIAVNPNRPSLLCLHDPKCEAISREDYMQAFGNELNAVVVSKAEPHIMKHSEEALAPKLKALPAHLKDDSRFVPVGSGQTHERALFEKVYFGKVKLDLDGVMQLITEDGPIEIVYNDVLYFIDAKDNQIHKERISRFPAHVSEGPVLDAITHASSSVLIHRMK